MGGEPVTHQSQGHVALYVKDEKQHDTSHNGPRACEIYVTPSRLLLFHEQPIGWWGHDYAFGDIQGLEAQADKALMVKAGSHDARIELATMVERDALQGALKEAQTGAESVAAVSDDKLAAEAKVRTLRKLLEDGKITQDEYDHQAIQLLGLGTKPGASEEEQAPIKKSFWRR